MYGYMGKMLFVNLSTKKIEVRELTEDLAKNFLGGYGIGAKVLYDEMPAKADPFGPDSMIGFISGPMGNTKALFGGRYTVVSKSPVTGGWNDANSGGFFSPKLKASGFDAVFVNGVSDKPAFIFIDDGKAEIRDATKYWGMTSLAFEAELDKDLGDGVKAAYISPAGENLSLIACIMNDGHRAAGRGGSGAVMGSKKLKALVVRGAQKTEVYDDAELVNINKDIAQAMKEKPWTESLSNFGTGSGYVTSVLTSDAGIKNFAGDPGDYPEEVAKIVSSQGVDKYKTKKYACANCPVGCGAFLEVDDPRFPDLKETPRPEYETMGCFGSQMLNYDAVSIMMCNEYCNEYGIDTISAGATVAWAMDCYENGILSKEELDGIELKWGDGDAIVKMTEKLAKGDGVGAILQKGSMGAAKHYGRGFDQLVVASGIEEPQHDSRLAFNLARTYQFDPTPGRHVKGGGRLRHVIGQEPNFTGTGFSDMLGAASTEIINTSGACLMMGGCTNPKTYQKQINAITGFNLSNFDFVALGQRIYNMRQAFNVREGFKRGDYTLSKRLTESAPPHRGPIAGVKVDNEKLADNFFEAMGWSYDAIPLKATLEILGGLEKVIEDIYPPEA